MANALIVHDDSVISRVAYLLEEQKRNISTFEAILTGEDRRYEGVGVNLEDVKRALKTERQLLADMTGDFWLDMIAKELKDIRMAYCQIGGNDGEQV